MATAKKLSEVLSQEMQATLHQKAADYMDKNLIFHTAQLAKGEKGLFYRCVVSFTADGEQFYISTGAAQPSEILAWAKENKGFPFTGKLVKKGRATFLIDPD